MTLIERLENEFEINTPIFIEDLVDEDNDYNTVKAMLSFYTKKNYIKRYCTGVYYIPEKTFYGYSTICAEDVIKRKYLTDNVNVYGYYAGITLLNKVGLTTQVPYIIEVVTNNETNIKRTINISNTTIILRRSNIQINKENYKYLMFLEIFKYADLELLKENLDLLVDLYNTFELNKETLFKYLKLETNNIKCRFREVRFKDEIA